MATADVVRAAAVPRSAYALAIPLALLATGTLVRWLAWHTGTDTAVVGFAEAFCKWDCEWYADLVLNGYDGFPVVTDTMGGRNVGNWAFFPLTPMLMRAVVFIIPLPLPVLALLVPAATSVAACLVAWRLLGRDVPTYAVFCAYLLVGPFAVYFTTFLSEPLFVLLALCVLAAVRRGALLPAAGFAALLSATRIVGVFMVFVIAWRMVDDHRRAGGSWAGLPGAVLARPDWLLALLIAPLGLFAFMLFLYLQIGDGLAFSSVQRSWARVTAWPWEHLWYALAGFADGWPQPNQWNALAAMAGIAIAAFLLVRREIGTGIFALISIVLPLSAGVASQVRFVAALAPVAFAANGRVALSPAAAAVIVAGLHVAGFAITVAWLGGADALI